MNAITLNTAKGRLHLPHFPVDKIGVEERAASFTKRSIKKNSKMDALLTHYDGGSDNLGRS